MTEARSTASCPVCHGAIDRRLPVSTGPASGKMELAFDLVECRVCKLVRLEHLMTKESLDAYSNAYYEVLRKGMAEKRSEKALRLFRERASLFDHLERGRLLDVGCERGYFLEVMRRRGWQPEGIEPYTPFAEHARAEFGLPIATRKLEELDTATRFRLVTLWHVLEHFDDPADAFGRCSRLLEPGGLLFLEVPNIDSLGAAVADTYWLAFREPSHRWFFRPDSLRRLAEQAGLSVEKIAAVGSPAGWYGFKRGIRGRICARDYWHSKIERTLPAPPAWRRALGSLVTFYPFVKTLAWLGDTFGKGEVLHCWCRKPG